MFKFLKMRYNLQIESKGKTKNFKLFLSLLVLFVIPNIVSARTERTAQLDLSSMDLTVNQKDASEGWQ